MHFRKDALHSDIQCGFLREYYTRTYSKIFEFILHSDVQYDFLSSSSPSIALNTVFEKQETKGRF